MVKVRNPYTKEKENVSVKKASRRWMDAIKNPTPENQLKSTRIWLSFHIISMTAITFYLIFFTKLWFLIFLWLFTIPMSISQLIGINQALRSMRKIQEKGVEQIKLDDLFHEDIGEGELYPTQQEGEENE